MSACPLCSRIFCDHTAAERGQTEEQMNAPLTEEELNRFQERTRAEQANVTAAHGIEFKDD